jgi:O-antigen/teichoic acid export membrane protein
VTDLDRKIVRGSAWLALSFGGSQVVSLVTTAVLAHFLTPSAFGLVALAAVAIAVVTTVQESGLGLAIIHKRDDVERAAGTVLVFSVLMGFVLYGVAFAVAPLLARVFHSPGLTDVVRVLTLLLIPRGFSMVPGVLIERELRFGARAAGELGGAGAQAALAIPLAVAGAGVWSLVAGQLLASVVTAVAFWWLAPFRPRARAFSWPLLRELGRYGRHVTAANVLALIDQNVDTATVGRLLGTVDVGFYNLAWRLSNLPATGIGYVVGRVMFPAYATLQTDKNAFRSVFVTNVRRIALVALPVGIGVILAAEPIIVGIFGAKWKPAVVPLEILGAFGIIRAFSGTTGAVFQAAGRPQLVTWLNVWHLLLLCATLFTLTPAFGLKGTATGVTVTAGLTLVPAYRFALRILELRLRDLVLALEWPLLVSVPLTAVLALARETTGGVSPVLRLVMLAVAGFAAYAASVAVFARGEVKEIAAAFRSS